VDYQEEVIGLEGGVSYPLGDDFFRISHGADYFRFFDRLGKVYYIVGLHPVNERVVGAQCFILRHVPMTIGDSRLKPLWYSCDTKVHPDHRKDGLGAELLKAYFSKNMAMSQLRHRCVLRGYGISMNTSTGKNRMKDHSKSWGKSLPGLNVRSETLHLYSLTYDDIRRAETVLKQHRGALSYLSLNGVKDIILQSSGEAMPLLHVQWGPLADPRARAEPLEEHIHMFCAVRGSPLALAAEKDLRLEPSGTATIYSIRVKTDYSFVLTSDI